MGKGWTRAESSEYIDIHEELLPFELILEFFEQVESEDDVLRYCNGANEGGRWIFQIYSIEFMDQVADLLNEFYIGRNQAGTVLEVMSGDGKLSEFLRPRIRSEIISTDGRIGNYGIAYPKWVENLDAFEALREYEPDIVILSWEPFYSSVGLEIVETGVPTIWIGDRRHSAVHSDLFERSHVRVRSRYALGRHDSFSNHQFETDIYLFNWQSV